MRQTRKGIHTYEMKAAQIIKRRVFRLVERDFPQPGFGECE